MMKKEDLQERIQGIIELGNDSLSWETGKNNIVEGPSFNEFIAKCKILLYRYICNHELYSDLNCTINAGDNNTKDSIKKILGFLKVLKYDEDYWKNYQEGMMEMNNKVFIVHGHDIGKRDEVEQLLRRIGLEPIILMNESNRGLTLIEKIEMYSDVGYGIMLYSGCDQGKEKGSTKKYRLRARQNVVFEHGYLMSKLGRGNVAALVDENVETPGDLSGLVYISFSESDWKMKLMRELKDAGFVFDATKA